MSWRTTVGRRAAERNPAGELPKGTRQEGCRKNTGRKADRELPKKFRQIADGKIPAGELPKKPRQEAAKIVSAESYRENTGKKADGSKPAESCGINFGRTLLPARAHPGRWNNSSGGTSERTPAREKVCQNTHRQTLSGRHTAARATLPGKTPADTASSRNITVRAILPAQTPADTVWQSNYRQSTTLRDGSEHLNSGRRSACGSLTDSEPSEG